MEKPKISPSQAVYSAPSHFKRKKLDSCNMIMDTFNKTVHKAVLYCCLPIIKKSFYNFAKLLKTTSSPLFRRNRIYNISKARNIVYGGTQAVESRIETPARPTCLYGEISKRTFDFTVSCVCSRTIGNKPADATHVDSRRAIQNETLAMSTFQTMIIQIVTRIQTPHLYLASAPLYCA